MLRNSICKLFFQLVDTDLPLPMAFDCFGNRSNLLALQQTAQAIHLLIVMRIASLIDTPYDHEQAVPLWHIHDLYENPNQWLDQPACDSYILRITSTGKSIWKNEQEYLISQILQHLTAKEQ
jgi:hypothetical protein